MNDDDYKLEDLFRMKDGLSWVGMGWSGATGGIGARLLILDDVIGTSQAHRSSATRAQIREWARRRLGQRIAAEK